MYSWYKRKHTCLLHCGTRGYTNIYISLVVQEEPHLSSMVEQVETQLYGLMELKKWEREQEEWLCGGTSVYGSVEQEEIQVYGLVEHKETNGGQSYFVC
jgi:hypothetical protein